MSSQIEIYNSINSNQVNIAVGDGKGQTYGKYGRQFLGEHNHQGTKIQPFRAAKLANAGGLKQADIENFQHEKENIHDEQESENVQDQEIDDSNISLMSNPEINDVPMLMDEPCMDDTADDNDYLTSPEYAKDVYLYLRQIENKNKPKWNYMSKQTEVTHSMRSILIDWLVEVATEYKLQSETLHLTISYVDRFLSVMSVQKSKIQLLGVTSMLIAAKVEEVYPPNISDLIYITCDSYTKKHILRMEVLLLKVLAFDLCMPTSHLFVNKYCHMFQLHQKCISLATYINELSLLDGETFLRFSPSILAASSVALARHTLGDQAWTEEMVAISGYGLTDLRHCFLSLQQAFREADMHPQQFIQTKYRSFRFHNVADIAPRYI